MRLTNGLKQTDTIPLARAVAAVDRKRKIIITALKRCDVRRDARVRAHGGISWVLPGDKARFVFGMTASLLHVLPLPTNWPRSVKIKTIIIMKKK